MEPSTDLVGYPITLLIERVFWLSLGLFFALTLISSLLRALKEKNNKEIVITPKDLEKLANKAIKENKDKD